MSSYIAVIHKESDSEYGVSFPDFPGCVTAGSTVDEAKDMAFEALQFHVDGMLEDREKIPEPSSLECLVGNTELDECVFFLVPVDTRPSKSVKFNATMDERLLTELDAMLKRYNESRSAFFAKAAKEAIKSEKFWEGQAMQAMFAKQNPLKKTKGVAKVAVSSRKRNEDYSTRK